MFLLRQVSSEGDYPLRQMDNPRQIQVPNKDTSHSKELEIAFN